MPTIISTCIANAYYSQLKLSDWNLLENMKSLAVFGTDFSFGLLKKQVDKGHWRNYGAVATVNAFYSKVENSIRKFGYYIALDIKFTVVHYG